jgi:hypothetical protein
MAPESEGSFLDTERGESGSSGPGAFGPPGSRTRSALAALARTAAEAHLLDPTSTIVDYGRCAERVTDYTDPGPSGYTHPGAGTHPGTRR